MEFMGVELIDTFQEGDLFALFSPSGDFYHAQRISGRLFWEFSVQGNETSINASAVVELLKSECGDYAGFRSHHAEGKILQACRDKSICLRFNNYNFDKWEQWSIYGNSPNKCLLVNRKFPDKRFEASFHRVLIVTELSLDTFLKKLNVKVKNEILQGFGEKAEEQLHKFPSQAQPSTSFIIEDASLRSNSKLHKILDDFCTSILTEARNMTRSVKSILIEKQALEYGSKLAYVQEKVQDLEMRLLHVQESTMIYRKKADEKIALLLNDLEHAQMDAKRAAADQLKLKLIEADCIQLLNELHCIKSRVNEMELQNKIAEEEVQKFASEAKKSHERVCELEMLLDATQMMKKTVEEKLVSQSESHQEVKAMGSEEEILRESLQRLDEKLDLTRKRAFVSEHNQRLAATREEECLRQPKLIEETSRSIERSLGLQNAVENINKKHSNIVSKSIHNEMATRGTERDSRLRELEIERTKFQQAYINAEKTIRDLEAQLKDAKLLIENHKRRSQEFEDREIHDGKRILELVKKLEISEDEAKSNKEHVISLQLELHELQVGSNIIADALEEAEIKAADLKLAISDQDGVFCQKCQELEDAVTYLSDKLVKLESAHKMIHSEIRSARDNVKILQIDKVKLEHLIMELEERVKVAENYSVSIGTSNKNMMHRNSELQGLLKRKEAENIEAARQIIELEANLSQARHENFSHELMMKSAEEKCSKMEWSVRQMSKKLLEVSKETMNQDEESLGQIVDASKQANDRSAAGLEEPLVHHDVDRTFLYESGHDWMLAPRKKPAELETKLHNVETSLLYHEKVIKKSVERFEELESLTKFSHTEAKNATQKAACMEALLVAAEQHYKQSETKVKDLTKDLKLLDVELKRVKTEADSAVVQLEEAEKRMAEILPSIDRLREAEILVSCLKERVLMAEGRATKAEADLHESTIKMSTLRIELSNNEEMIKNLQVSLSEVENHRQTLGAQIEKVTRSFSELNKQLEHERQHLQVQIARKRQVVETLKQENAELQEQLQESLSDAKACGIKLKESLLWKTVLEREVQNLKSQIKKSKIKSNFSDFFKNIKEWDLSVDSALGKSLTRKQKDAVGELQVSSASKKKVNGRSSDPQCSSTSSWVLPCLFVVLCTCFLIKFGW